MAIPKFNHTSIRVLIEIPIEKFYDLTSFFRTKNRKKQHNQAFSQKNTQERGFVY